MCKAQRSNLARNWALSCFLGECSSMRLFWSEGPKRLKVKEYSTLYLHLQALPYAMAEAGLVFGCLVSKPSWCKAFNRFERILSCTVAFSSSDGIDTDELAKEGQCPPCGQLRASWSLSRWLVFSDVFSTCSRCFYAKMQLLSCLLLKAWSIHWLASLSTIIFERVARQKPHTVPGRCGEWTIWPLDLGSWNHWCQDRCKILRCQETEKDQKVYDLNPRSTKVKKLLSDAGGAECLWWDFGRHGVQAMLRFQTLWNRAVHNYTTLVRVCQRRPIVVWCIVLYSSALHV